jgi:hypothetical protein
MVDGKPSDPKARELFDKLPQCMQDYLSYTKYQISNYKAEKDLVVVPISNPNGHGYLLDHPVQFIADGDCACYCFGGKASIYTGRNMSLSLSAVRAPCKEEIVAMLCARNSSIGFRDW